MPDTELKKIYDASLAILKETEGYPMKPLGANDKNLASTPGGLLLYRTPFSMAVGYAVGFIDPDKRNAGIYLEGPRQLFPSIALPEELIGVEQVLSDPSLSLNLTVSYDPLNHVALAAASEHIDPGEFPSRDRGEIDKFVLELSYNPHFATKDIAAMGVQNTYSFPGRILMPEELEQPSYVRSGQPTTPKDIALLRSAVNTLSSRLTIQA